MKLKRIKELIAVLNNANRAYYQEDREIMSNLEYDALYDELSRLEEETGVTLAGSPTRRVGYEVVSGLKKAQHDAPMLSLDKTKETEALAAFLGEHDGLLSWKLDGLTVVLRYDGGELQQAVTRGNGTVGEDITHNAKVFRNVPLTVPHKGKFDLRGEAVISIADFDAINELEDGKYKNPRNLCSGAVRQLNSETAAKRRVLFFAFSLKSEMAFEKKHEQLKWLAAQGFEIAEYEIVTAENVAQTVARFKEKIPAEPLMSDGLVLTYDDIAHSESLGATSKFPRDSVAFKWADEIAETVLKEVEWGTSRTGLINPVAIFEPVDIEGTQVSRASLHNVSILRGLDLRRGDSITVYKANMIIPQVAENLSRSGAGDLEIPATCPVCGGETEIRQSSAEDPETLYCVNPNCGAQKIRALSHFVSRDALNIGGLSAQTLEKLIVGGMITDFLDLFCLEKFQNEITQMEGFGQKSYDNLIASIEAAKDVQLPNFVYALGIRHVGLATAKLLCKFFKHDALKIADACKDENYLETLSEIKGFGEAISHSLHVYFSQEKNLDMFARALEILRIQTPAEEQGEQPLDGLVFVITGDVTHFKNRKELQTVIENAGGRVTNSVTAKTSFLINNDALSSSSKNKKAAQLGIEILTEDEFLSKFSNLR
ncbi:MAG: NAD-dependent DNA ligase LigA [Defluviitaleaceae bacterium]|nr:NAD-dependent DNA ligase LigA [Defluviitaleaceae bacterium]MCL2263479.1 NAD-dependent DNA ligase LigA [Defluviitaleaceae bacterium]